MMRNRRAAQALTGVVAAVLLAGAGGLRADPVDTKAQDRTALHAGFAVMSEGYARNDPVLLAAAARLLGPALPQGDPLLAQIMADVAALADDAVLQGPADGAVLFKGRAGGALFQKKVVVAGSHDYAEPVTMDRSSRGVAYVAVYPKAEARNLSALVETEFGAVQCAPHPPEGSGVLQCIFDVDRDPNVTLVLRNKSLGPITAYLTVQ